MLIGLSTVLHCRQNVSVKLVVAVKRFTRNSPEKGVSRKFPHQEINLHSRQARPLHFEIRWDGKIWVHWCPVNYLHITIGLAESKWNQLNVFDIMLFSCQYNISHSGPGGWGWGGKSSSPPKAFCQCALFCEEPLNEPFLKEVAKMYIKISTLQELQSVTKIIETRYIFIKKPKKCLTCSKIPKTPPPPGSILCQNWKSYARQRWPEMSK